MSIYLLHGVGSWALRGMTLADLLEEKRILD